MHANTPYMAVMHICAGLHTTIIDINGRTGTQINASYSEEVCSM